VCKLTGHQEWVLSVAFSADGKRVVSGSWDNLVKIWNAETGAEVSSFVGGVDDGGVMVCFWGVSSTVCFGSGLR
jgi:WD40 repeat protein